MSQFYDLTTEEYIEVIHELEVKFRIARVKDIARLRGVTQSSVSTVLNQLIKKDLIKHESYGHVILTPVGLALARDLRMRHRMLKNFFKQILGLSEEISEQDACKIEHMISAETIQALTHFMECLDICPQNNENFVQRFKDCIQKNTTPNDWNTCQE